MVKWSNSSKHLEALIGFERYQHRVLARINPPCCSRWSLPSRRTKLAPVGQWRGRCSFARIIQANEHHVLQQLLPSPTCHKHGPRRRRHTYTLNIKTDYDDRSFITRMLYKDIYW